MAMGAAAAGSLAPDLDHPFSKASFGIPTALLSYGGIFLLVAGFQSRSTSPQMLDLSLLGEGYFTAARLAVAVGLILLISSLLFGLLFSHRGPVHSLAFGGGITVAFTVGLAILGAPSWLWAPFAWGWIAHLLADATTPHGVPYLLWPLGTSLPGRHMPAPRTAPLASQVSKALRGPAARPVVAKRPEPHPVASRPNCPRCGIPMVLRTVKRGAHAGRTFYGCVNFPRCRQTRAIDRPELSPGRLPSAFIGRDERQTE